MLINLFHAKFAELADFALRRISYTDYAVAGIRRICRRLRYDGHAECLHYVFFQRIVDAFGILGIHMLMANKEYFYKFANQNQQKYQLKDI